ncbi:hypothetical protein BJY00DRAFT_311047 [Aspergillus carlsbadensis]|nr:hypothetical protein BJY00DRAFT_311047 [Aspergillus carlsbadensis]
MVWTPFWLIGTVVPDDIECAPINTPSPNEYLRVKYTWWLVNNIWRGSGVPNCYGKQTDSPWSLEFLVAVTIITNNHHESRIFIHPVSWKDK